MGFFKEFRDFAVRGNVVDMAVGIIIGAAFGGIVTSLVNDIIMPPIGLVLGNMDFADLAITLREAAGEETPAVTIGYGLFLNKVINFIIVAFAIFLVIKQINRFKKAPPPPAPSTRPCPFCQSEISLKAVRCPNCTSQLEAASSGAR